MAEVEADSVAATALTVATERDALAVDFTGFTLVASADPSCPPLCAPPLLLTVTPGATSVVDDVDPEVFGGSVSGDVVEPPAEVEPLPVDGVDVEPVVGVSDSVDGFSVPVDDAPVDAELDELAEPDSDDAPVVSAAATPWPVATAATSQAATAMPP
ncbi:MAG: hypothetical protein HYZ39_00210 [Mycolicibacterium cosmeticum]|nr:hypothetical protein [Mycolicibacterium cosmeticum]